MEIMVPTKYIFMCMESSIPVLPIEVERTDSPAPSGDIRAFPKGPETKRPLKKGLEFKGPMKKGSVTKGPYNKGTW